MSIGLFIKQKKFIASELKKGRTDYEKIYQEAKEKQPEEEKKLLLNHIDDHKKYIKSRDRRIK